MIIMRHYSYILTLSFALLLSWSPTEAQVTLEQCYAAAEAHYPVAKQYGVTAMAKEYNLSNASRSWWPQVSVEASAQVQSEVTKLPFDLSKLGLTGVDGLSLSKDHYAVTAAATQLLYDGGEVAARRRVIEASADAEDKATATSIYALREQVNQVFFGILLTDEQLAINALLQENLRLNLGRAESLERGGLAHQADIDAVRVEQLKAEQAAVNYKATRRAYIAMLAALTGLELDESSTLVKPQDVSIKEYSNSNNVAALQVSPSGGDLEGASSLDFSGRPELSAFAAQLRQVEASRQQLNAALRPRLALFAQGGYGRPGLNMLSNDFSFYGIAGVRLTWNISSLYTRRNDLDLLSNRADAIRTQQAAFLYRTSVEEAERRATLSRYDALLQHDDEIITLRERIRRASEAKFTGGTMTATDLTRDINDEQQARQDRALHEMQRLLAAYNLRFTRGDLK